MMDPHAVALAEALYEDELFDEFEEEELFESFPPEYLARSMADALERLKNFDPLL
ncbi:MAG: hypothetical protein H6993_11700 [Pseudomonadales bacterium]|nr:hypothetical protein [Pseudomonadales bacterium]